MRMNTQTTDMARPLMSVIIPTRNRAQYIERSLLSIFHEIDTNYPNAEVIVIDGKSTDNTVDILHKYDNRIAYWISEPDSGVGEAINKGLARAHGEIIRIFGDDDDIIPGWTKYMVDYLLSRPNLDVLIGHSEFILEDFQGNQSPLPLKQPSGRLAYRDLLRIGGATGQPSPEVSFSRRAVFEKCGGYNVNFHYFAYIDLWLRFAKAGVTFEAIPVTIAKRYQTPQSDSIKGNRKKMDAEYLRLMQKHGDIQWWLTDGIKMYFSRHVIYPLYTLCHRLNLHPMRTLRRLMA